MTTSVAVIDTNVVSYLFKGDTRAASYKSLIAPFEIRLISFQTLAELNFWALSAAWGRRRRADLSYFLEGFEVVHSDERTCDLWAKVKAQRGARGRPIQPGDAWIAAVAMDLDCPLLTHDPADFEGIEGLRVLTALRGGD